MTQKRTLVEWSNSHAMRLYKAALIAQEGRSLGRRRQSQQHQHRDPAERCGDPVPSLEASELGTPLLA
ncbi:MAG: hypothetical protein ACR2OF_05080 [Hyphomicrobium sp.]